MTSRFNIVSVFLKMSLPDCIGIIRKFIVEGIERAVKEAAGAAGTGQHLAGVSHQLAKTFKYGHRVAIRIYNMKRIKCFI